MADAFDKLRMMEDEMNKYFYSEIPTMLPMRYIFSVIF